MEFWCFCGARRLVPLLLLFFFFVAGAVDAVAVTTVVEVPEIVTVTKAAGTTAIITRTLSASPTTLSTSVLPTTTPTSSTSASTPSSSSTATAAGLTPSQIKIIIVASTIGGTAVLAALSTGIYFAVKHARKKAARRRTPLEDAFFAPTSSTLPPLPPALSKMDMGAMMESPPLPLPPPAHALDVDGYAFHGLSAPPPPVGPGKAKRGELRIWTGGWEGAPGTGR